MGGILLMGVGTVAPGGGITLVTIGKNKSIQYKQLMQNDPNELSLNMTDQGLIPRLNF